MGLPSPPLEERGGEEEAVGSWWRHSTQPPRTLLGAASEELAGGQLQGTLGGGPKADGGTCLQGIFTPRSPRAK